MKDCGGLGAGLEWDLCLENVFNDNWQRKVTENGIELSGVADGDETERVDFSRMCLTMIDDHPIVSGPKLLCAAVLRGLGHAQ